MQRMALKPMTHGGRPSSTATTAAIKQAQQPSAENFEWPEFTVITLRSTY